MAGEELQSALGGLAFSGMDNPYGIAASALGTATPGMISPYASTGQALGIGLGSILLQSLLGYQARQSALQDTLQANTLANQMLKMQTPEERTSFIGGLDVSPQIGTRLSTLSTALQQQELARKVAQDAKIAELETKAKFDLGPLATQLFEREKQKEIDIADARLKALTLSRGGGEMPKPEKDFFEKIPAAQKSAFTSATGQVQQLRNLANTFRELGSNAIELNLQKQIPGSKADLAFSAMQTLVPSTVKMLGDTGALSAYDQEAVRTATLGGRTSGSESIAARLDQLAELAQSKTIATLEQYKNAAEVGGTGLLEQLKASQGTSSPTLDAKMQKLEALKAQLAELKAGRGAK